MTTTVAGAAEATDPRCAALREMLEGGIPKGTLQVTTALDGRSGYFNIDIDGDDANDFIEGGCAASIQPADPCYLEVRLSTGKQYAFEFKIEERFALIRHKGKYYAVATAHGTEPAKRVRTVYELSASGINIVCSNL
jgi:hypothetical protein